MINRLRERLLDRFPWLGWYAWAQVRRGTYHRDGSAKR